MGENFSNQISEIKFSETQLRNIIKNTNGNINPTREYLQATEKWFHDKGGINEQTIAMFIREGLHKEFDQQKGKKVLDVGELDRVVSCIIDKFIPQLTLGNNMDQALYEVEAAIAQPVTPEKLVEAIADYLKKHMKYDVLTAISSIMPDGISVALSSDKHDFKKEIDSNLRKIQNNSQIQFNSSYKEQLIDSLSNLINKKGIKDNRTNKFIKTFLVELKKPKANQEDIKRFLTSEFLKMSPIEASSIGGMILGMNEMQKIEVTDIGVLISEYKIGVCRHYSIIAKKMYAAIKERHLDNLSLQDSELLYVLNTDLRHAYNVLMYTDEKGAIKKTYLDITSFITKNNLYPETTQSKKSLARKREAEILTNAFEITNTEVNA